MRANPTKRLNGLAQQRENQLAVLDWTHKFGWLTVPDYVALIWPTAKRGSEMAVRTCQALIDQRMLIAAPSAAAQQARQTDSTDLRQCAFVLDRKGASELRRALNPKNLTSGLRLLCAPSHHKHRSLSNRYVIHSLHEGFKAFTEREVQVGWIIKCFVNGKVPDALVYKPSIDGLAGYVKWVEVEQSWKKSSNYETLLKFVEYFFAIRDCITLTLGLPMTKFVLACNERHHIKRFVKAITARWIAMKLNPQYLDTRVFVAHEESDHGNWEEKSVMSVYQGDPKTFGADPWLIQTHVSDQYV